MFTHVNMFDFDCKPGGLFVTCSITTKYGWHNKHQITLHYHVRDTPGTVGGSIFCVGND